MSKINSDAISTLEAGWIEQGDLTHVEAVKLNLDELFEVVQKFDPVEAMVRRT
jgi:hypothetical protein